MEIDISYCGGRCQIRSSERPLIFFRLVAAKITTT
jgi:hypothetical protein